MYFVKAILWHTFLFSSYRNCFSARFFVSFVKVKSSTIEMDPEIPDKLKSEKATSDIQGLKDVSPLPSSTDTGSPLASHTSKRKLENPDFNFAKSAKSKRSKPFRPGIGDDKFEETDYYFENGLRKVYPYMYTFTTFCKGRWVGKPLLEVFSEEFRAHAKEEYESCIKSGYLTVNNKSVQPDYILKDCDLIANCVHRHEIPVLASPIKILHQSKDLLVIDKPPSIPVHPCGRYRSNTIVFILGKECGLKDLHVLHRLDRLTSGVLMFGLEKEKTRKIEEQIRDRAVSKEYLCRVEGNFPDGLVKCDEPMNSISFKIGVCMVDPNGKPCRTQFEKQSFNGKSSVVLCRPETGRMHQIRVHLQYLGFPIVNDPIYNHSVFGPLKGKGGNFGKTKEKLVEELMAAHTADSWLGSDEEISGNTLENDDYQIALKSLKHYTDGEDFKTLSDKYRLKKEKLVEVQNCSSCKLKYRDPRASDLVMFLHAWKYKGEGFNFESSIPVWAKEDWTYS